MVAEKYLPGFYCDMDGVLVDFKQGAHKAIGKDLNHPNNEITKADWIKISRNTRFWFDLPPMSDAMVLWDYIRRFNPSILSAYPDSDKQNAIRGKIYWCVKHLLIPTSRIHIVSRKDKQLFAIDRKTRQPNILIDDYEENIEEWRKAGGIAIHHVGARSTIAKIERLGYYK